MASDLRAHLALCGEILAVVELESHELRQSGAPRLDSVTGRKNNLLPKLTQSLDRIRQRRMQWQRLDARARGAVPEIPALLRQNQDLIMKIIVLDRENEQALLRKGLIPARQIPPANRTRPHFVADLYRRARTD